MSSVVVAGALAQRPEYGGHAWAVLQYPLGMKRLGYDVLFVDQLTPQMLGGAMDRSARAAQQRCIQWFRTATAAVGIPSGCALFLNGSQEVVGMSRQSALQRIAEADALLNIAGFISDEEILGTARRRVFVDIDPGFPQMWRELGLADILSVHDEFVTLGENIGRSDCGLPTCGLTWRRTRPPVDLMAWQPVEGGTRFTTIGSWRGPFDAIEFRDRRYGLRAHEFRRFTELPARSGIECEVALEVEESDHDDIARLQQGGWRLADPRAVAASPDRYRDYIRQSKAEIMIAKEMYVATQSGWFSDRSACYLASGKPVLAQDTGFSRNYPVGEGLLGFSNLDEAVEGAREISGNWRRHARAAREIAEEYFDSRKVLGDLLASLGLS
jgi:hypothetical protein